MSTARTLLLVAVAIALAGLFVRLGFWQLDRHVQRSSASATREERLAMPALDWTEAGAVPADTAGTLGRRVRLEGRWVPEHEVILRSRASNGRAGVEVFTPLVPAPGEPALFVLRGWLPAADGLRADLRAGWTAADSGTVRVEGVLIASRDGRGGEPLRVEVGDREHLALAGIDLGQIRDELPLTVGPHVVRASDPEPGASPLRPARALQSGAGPHMSYAIQWFAFAVIALVGTGILIAKERGG